MSEITKLYENAGINQVCNTCELRGFKRLCPTKELCVRTNPAFTAEKQIELIKWLARYNFVVCKNLGGWHTGLNPTYDEDFGITCNKRATNFGSFEYALAGLINVIWQDLTEEEKQQIKEILK